AVLKGLRYAHQLRPDEIRAVHFMIDEKHTRGLMARWEDTAGTTVPLEVVACPDRRLRRAVLDLAARVTHDGGTALTLLVPRRTYAPIFGLILHRGTGDAMARTLEDLPNVAVTVLPFDVEKAVASMAAGRPPEAV
ncbi:MAG: DNA-binding protein, partial [Streptomycetaceae bacterium]|nr:DNA-binding protein [Streptomycetaceae bacterium]